VPALLAIRRALEALPRDIVLDEKRKQMDRIIQWCLGLSVSTTTPRAEVVQDEELPIRFSATVTSDVSVRWIGVQFPLKDYAARDFSFATARQLGRGQASAHESVQMPLRDTPLTQPYWLREEGSAGRFRVSEPLLIGSAENAPPLPVEYVFDVGGQRLLIPDEPVQVTSNASAATARRRLNVIAPVSLSFISEAGVFVPGASREVNVTVTAARDGALGTLGLNVPDGWLVAPSSRQFRLAAAGDSATFTFSVSAPAREEQGAITAFARIGEGQFTNQRIEVRYDHIPMQLLQSPARLKAASFELAIRGRSVGYVPGAGDRTVESMRQMGYEVTELSSGDYSVERLRNFDAVVIGIRAYNVNTDFPAANDALFAYVEQGGTLVTQYNPTAGLRTTAVAPLPLVLSDGRVTNENAAVTFLAPDHPALNTPNRITAADFSGWVQELGLYFPRSWDERFVPLIAASDEGEEPLRGALLVARYGSGHFVYTGLSFFRQLPAGVPGAYRLFANLLSLGARSPALPPR
jgi:hypothetical protein